MKTNSFYFKGVFYYWNISWKRSNFKFKTDFEQIKFDDTGVEFDEGSDRADAKCSKFEKFSEVKIERDCLVISKIYRFYLPLSASAKG